MDQKQIKMKEVRQSVVKLVILVFLSASLRAEDNETLAVSQTHYSVHETPRQDDSYFYFLKTDKPTLSAFTREIDESYTAEGSHCENDCISAAALRHGTWFQAVTTLCLVAILLSSKRERIVLDSLILCNIVEFCKSDDYVSKEKLDYHHIFNFYKIPKQVNTVSMLSVEKMTGNLETGHNKPNGCSSNYDKGNVSENHGLLNKKRHNRSVVDGASNETSHSSRPRHPDFADKRARDQTFRNWPRSGKPDPDVISAAGFYSIDHGDSVRCFHCGGGLFDFTSNMDPFEEHLKYFPSCDYIRDYRQTHPRQAPCSKDERKRHQNVTEKKKPASSNSEQTQRMTYTDIKSLLEMGLKKHQVEELILRQFESGPETSSADSEPQTQASNEPTNMAVNVDNRNSNQRHDISSTQLSSTDRYKEQAREMSKGHSKRQKEAANCRIVKDDDAVHSLKEENHKLREIMLCKICLDRNSSIVFLNCGHMVSCQECAPSLRKCPICKKLIRDRIFVDN